MKPLPLLLNPKISPFLMRTVANCLNMSQALRIQILLDSRGIKSFIPDENIATVAPYLFATRSGVRIQVSEEDEELAKSFILDDADNNESVLK